MTVDKHLVHLSLWQDWMALDIMVDEHLVHLSLWQDWMALDIDMTQFAGSRHGNGELAHIPWAGQTPSQPCPSLWRSPSLGWRLTSHFILGSSLWRSLGLDKTPSQPCPSLWRAPSLGWRLISHFVLGSPLSIMQPSQYLSNSNIVVGSPHLKLYVRSSRGIKEVSASLCESYFLFTLLSATRSVPRKNVHSFMSKLCRELRRNMMFLDTVCTSFVHFHFFSVGRTEYCTSHSFLLVQNCVILSKSYQSTQRN